MKMLSRRPWARVESTEEQWHHLLETPPAGLYPGLSHTRLLLDAPRKLGKVVTRTLQFLSPVETGHAANDIVRGVKWHAINGADGEDALVMLHSAYADSFGTERKLAREAVSDGAHVYCLTLPYHMRRQPAGSRFSGQYLLSPDVPRLALGVIQAVAETAALIATLRHTGYRRVTLAGMSLGGLVGALAALHVKVDGIFLMLPALDPFETTYKGVADPELDEARVRRVLDKITPSRLGKPLVRPCDVLVAYGQFDMMCPPDQVEQLCSAWPGINTRSFPSGHLTMSRHFPEISEMLAQFHSAHGP